MTQTLLDPTGEYGAAHRQPLEKPSALDGLTVGLLDISKARGDVFLDRIDALFSARGVKTVRYKKPTFARTAPVDLVQEIAREVDVVVEGLAD